MSIATRTGDDGSTGLMYNRRVSKSDLRVEAYGCVDELNAALGLARALSPHTFVKDHLLMIQKNLVALMGELATAPEDRSRYLQEGYAVVTPAMTAHADDVIKSIEAQNVSFQGWATPGAAPDAAALDLARTTGRRAERRIVALHNQQLLLNPEILVYLNRLSDTLWLLARWAEGQAPGQ